MTARPSMDRTKAGHLQDSVWDAAVVGAGPAGAMAAYELSRLGRRVLLVDRQIFPRLKVCGATLSLGVRLLLADAGLGRLLEECGAQPLRAIRLGGWTTEAEVPLNGVVALSRLAFDSALIRAATGAGATLITGARAKLGPLLPDRRILSVTVADESFDVSARVIIAADGLSSGLMAQAGEPSRIQKSGRRPVIGLGGVVPASRPDGAAGSLAAYAAGKIHMAIGKDGYVGLVRVEDGSLNVAAAVSPLALKEAGSPTSLLGSLLDGAGWPSIPEEAAPEWKGTPELTRRPERPGAERIFAVGDASGYVEPFTGEGMFWALSGARSLAPFAARVEERWAPAILGSWTAAHRRLLGRAQLLCRTTAWALARPSLAHLALRTLKRHPRLAGPLVRRVGAPIPPRSPVAP